MRAAPSRQGLVRAQDQLHRSRSIAPGQLGELPGPRVRPRLSLNCAPPQACHGRRTRGKAADGIRTHHLLHGNYLIGLRGAPAVGVYRSSPRVSCFRAPRRLRRFPEVSLPCCCPRVAPALVRHPPRRTHERRARWVACCRTAPYAPATTAPRPNKPRVRLGRSSAPPRTRRGSPNIERTEPTRCSGADDPEVYEQTLEARRFGC